MNIPWLPTIDTAAILVIGAVCVVLMLLSGWYDVNRRRR